MTEQAKTEAKKPGIKSTEFWLPGAALAGLQQMIGGEGVSDGVQIAASIGIAVIAVGYIAGRTAIKLRAEGKDGAK